MVCEMENRRATCFEASAVPPEMGRGERGVVCEGVRRGAGCSGRGRRLRKGQKGERMVRTKPVLLAAFRI